MTSRVSGPSFPPYAARFPGLWRCDADDRLFVHADAPGGTQVVDSVIDAMGGYLRRSNANPSRCFRTSAESAELIDSVRARCADLLGGLPEGVVFGASATVLVRHFARAFAETLSPGDNIVCTQLDHDANVAPWLDAARRSGAEVRLVPLDPASGQLEDQALSRLVDVRTRLIAFTRTSNLLGTAVPERPFVEAARSVDALTFADGVAAAAHRPLDQGPLDIDVSVCSAYKFFGPHIAVLTARPEVLDRLVPDKVRPAPERGPRRWEPGMLATEAIAGLGAAVDYLTETGYRAIASRERALTERTLAGLRELRRIRLHGVNAVDGREPTFAVTVAGMLPSDVASQLSRQGVFVSSGNNYAVECVRALGLPEHDGVIRFGFVHYHSAEDVDRVLQALADLRPCAD